MTVLDAWTGFFGIRSECEVLGSIMRGRLSGRMQRLKECHKRSRFRRTQILSVGRHISAALDHLSDQLILGKAQSNAIERRSALPSLAIQRMAIVALLCLENQRTSPLESRACSQIFRWDWQAAPGVHHWTPRRVLAQLGERTQSHGGEKNQENCNRPPPPALLTFSSHKWKR
jgi:hypothetical protein